MCTTTKKTLKFCSDVLNNKWLAPPGCFLSMKKYGSFQLLFLLCGLELAAQGIVLENTPASLKYNQIVTDHFNILFPEGFEKEGQRMANTLEHLHKPVSRTLGVEPRPIPLILQNQGTLSNGFVTLGPRRSEFFTVPPQDYKFLGNNDWLNELAVHEFRHIVQYDKALTGWSKYVYWLLGEDAFAGLAFISTPLWLWEGDAVGIETAFTYSGRGRIAYFQTLHRANVLDRGGFPYNKQFLRSYRHQIPNHYLTGYLMTTFLRRTYGEDVLDRVTQRSFSRPIIPFTFSTALKKETGNNLLANYRRMSAEIDSLYRRQVGELNLSPFENLTRRKDNAFTEYAYPQVLANGDIYAIRYGIGDISQLVKMSADGSWQAHHTLGAWDDSGYISSGGGKIVWNEMFFHPRFERISYSGIAVYDIATGKVHRVGKRARYKGAAISPDGEKLVTLEVSLDNSFRLKLLKTSNGEVLKTFENPDNRLYTMPRFSVDGSQIVVLKHLPPLKQLVSIDIETGKERVWHSAKEDNFGHPFMTESHIFFSSDRTGIDNIFAIEQATGSLFQITSSRLGAYNPFVSPRSELFYNEMTKDGWDVVKVQVEPSAWIAESNVQDGSVDYFAPLVEQENAQKYLETVPEKNYPVSRYKRLRHLFRPYGWGIINTLSDNQIQLGLYSQNILSTLLLDAGYVVNLNEGAGYWTGNLSYQGFWPIIDAGFNSGTRSVIQSADGQATLYNWEENSFYTGLRLPITLTHSAYRENASFSLRVSSTSIRDFNRPFDIFEQRNGTLNAFKASASYSRLLKQSKRDIYPRWGQSISLHYFDTPFREGQFFKNNDYLSTLWSAETYLYFPGLFRNHSFRLRGAFQNEAVSNYAFRSEIQYVRGFSYQSFQEQATFSANYALPLWYPDIALGPVIYFQRFRANAFYDYGIARTEDLQRDFYSVGMDLLADFNVLRYLPVFSAGARVVYVPEQNTFLFNVLVGSVRF